MKSVVFLALCTSFAWSLNAPKKQILHVNKNINKHIKGRIISGDPVDPGEFPFMAAINAITSSGRIFCGGALIDPSWILTAGNCVYESVRFEVTLGVVSLSDNSPNRIDINATEYVIHPDFDDNTLVNNVGLINIPAVDVNDYVKVIPLPTSDIDEMTVFWSTGWGQTDDETPAPVDTLLKTGMLAISNAACRLVYGNQVIDSMVCAIGVVNEGICIGDIGGPLFEPGAPGHAAIASFLSGNGCESSDPSGYERTFPHVDWIKNVTGIN